MSYWNRDYRDYQAERDARMLLLLTILTILSILIIVGLCKISAELTIWSYQVINRILKKKTNTDYANVISSNNFRRSVYWFESILVFFLVFLLIIYFIINPGLGGFPNLSGLVTYVLFYLVVSTAFRLFYLYFIYRINIANSILFVGGYYVSHFTLVLLCVTPIFFLPVLIKQADISLQSRSKKPVSITENSDFQDIQRFFNKKDIGILNITQPSSLVKEIIINSNYPSYVMVVLQSLEYQNNKYSSNKSNRRQSGVYVIGVQGKSRINVLVEPGKYEVYTVVKDHNNEFYSYRANQLLRVQKQKITSFSVEENLENNSTHDDIRNVSQLISDTNVATNIIKN